MMGTEPLPPFTAEGRLPVGTYPLTLPMLRSSYLVTGDGVESSAWDTAWRASLVDNLGTLARQLWAVGIDEIFVDGSFVEAKDHPRDIDGYFVCDLRRAVSGQLENELNALDSHKIWTWDISRRRPASGQAHSPLPMWHQYRVELYPHYGQAFERLPGGVVTAATWFRQTRELRRKGIIQLIKEDGV